MGCKISVKDKQKAKSYDTGNVRINVRTIRHVHLINVAMEKQYVITYSECVSVALVIQHAKQTCCIIL